MPRTPALALCLLVLSSCHRPEPAAVVAFKNGTADPSSPIPAQFAGVRYPARGELLNGEVSGLLNKSGVPAPGSVLALVLPHAGISFSGAVAAEALSAVRDRRFDRVVILAPSHAGLAQGGVLPASRAMATPLGDLPLDSNAVALLAAEPGFSRSDVPYRGEHSVELVLPFIQQALGTVPIVPVLVGHLDLAGARQLASGLAQLLDSHTLLLVSTNFTHSGERFHSRIFGDIKGKELQARMGQADEILMKPMLAGDLEHFDALARSTQTTTCGHDALRVLLALLPPHSSGLVRRYDNSFAHDATTPEEEVSYAAVVYPGSWPEVAPLSAEDREVLLQRARQALVAQVEGRAPPPPQGGSPRLAEHHGVFVTVVEDGELRACVGRPESEDGLLQTVDAVAQAAAHADPRFPPLTQADLPRVRLELSLLGPLRPVRHPSELRLGTDGLYVGVEGHAGLVLPQVATELKLSHEQYLDAVAERVGVPRAQWRPEALRAFTVQVLNEPAGPASDAGP